MPGVELVLDGPHQREPRHGAVHTAAAGELLPHGGRRGEHHDPAALAGHAARSVPANPAAGPGVRRRGNRTYEHARAGRARDRRRHAGTAGGRLDRVEHATERGDPEGHPDQRLPGPGLRCARPPAGRLGGHLAVAEQVGHPHRPGLHPVDGPLEQHADPDRPARLRPAQLHRGGDKRRVRRRGDRVAGDGDGHVLGGDVRPGRGQRVQPEGCLGDQAERARRPGEQLAEVVAGHVLDDLAARLRDGPVGPHDGDADQQVARGAVAQPPRPGEPGRDDPADGGAGGHVKGDLLPGLREHGRDVAHPRPGLHTGDQVPGRVLHHA